MCDAPDCTDCNGDGATNEEEPCNHTVVIHGCKDGDGNWTSIRVESYLEGIL